MLLVFVAKLLRETARNTTSTTRMVPDSLRLFHSVLDRMGKMSVNPRLECRSKFMAWVVICESDILRHFLIRQNIPKSIL